MNLDAVKSYLLSIPATMYDPERVYTAMAAIFLCALVGMVTGPLYHNTNPFLWKMVNGIFGGIGARLDRPQRKAADLMFRGFIVLVVALAFFFIIGEAASKLAFEYPYKGFTEVLLLSVTMTVGTVWFALLQLYFARKDNKTSQKALSSLSLSTRTDLSNSDVFGVTRAGMSFAARAFDKGVVGPVFWYLLAGLPGAYIYTCLAAFGWRFGKDGFTKGFGTIPLILEKLMGVIPGGLAGALLAVSGLFTPTGGMTRALRALGPGKGHAKYEQGGSPVTALAFALNVSLGGPATDLDGSSLPRDWVGPDNATAQLENGHLRRALYMSLIAHMLFLASLMGALFWGGKLF
jgi:adenosylcobinamide-phosphate synthase